MTRTSQQVGVVVRARRALLAPDRPDSFYPLLAWIVARLAARLLPQGHPRRHPPLGLICPRMSARRTVAGMTKAATPDPTLDSLKRILDSGEYEVIPNVPIFDEHDEYDERGKVVRKFRKKELEAICAATNAREEETGDLAPFGPGHTIDAAPETMQPPVWGFFRNFRVGTFGPQKRVAILADKIVHKKYKADAGTYPRRSIELWTKDNVIDWVALLRRTPERDLGLLTYSKDRGVEFDPGPPQPLYYDATKRRPAAARLSPSGKLRYAMEANVADNNTPPADDQAFEQFCSMMDKYMARYQDKAKYAAGPGFPGGAGGMIPGHTPTGQAPPQTVPDDEKVRLQREADLIRFSRIEAELAQTKQQANYATCESLVKGLLYEGVECDPAAELQALLPLDQKGREARLDYVRRYHRKDPTGGGWVPLAPNINRPRETTKEERDAAVSYASKNGVGYDEALSRTRQAA